VVDEMPDLRMPGMSVQVKFQARNGLSSFNDENRLKRLIESLERRHRKERPNRRAVRNLLLRHDPHRDG
jgi:hypothetical protein